MKHQPTRKSLALLTPTVSLYCLSNYVNVNDIGDAAIKGSNVMASLSGFIRLAFGLVGLYNMGTGVAGFARNRQSQGADNSDNWKKLGVGAALFTLGWIVSIFLNSFGAESDAGVDTLILGGGL
jgi:hypothetical protein